MNEALLDTDMLNEVLKQRNATVVQHAADYIAQHGPLAISSITWYEVLRGLLEKNATTQLAQFRAFTGNTLLLPITTDILERAAHLWVSGRKQGFAPTDADLLIAATALDHGRSLVTGNTTHFTWIAGLVLDNWRIP